MKDRLPEPIAFRRMALELGDELGDLPILDAPDPVIIDPEDDYELPPEPPGRAFDPDTWLEPTLELPPPAPRPRDRSSIVPVWVLRGI